MYEVELYHHGIKGQKWGVRRFQKLDGTLTALGRRLANDGRVPKSIRDRAQFAVAKRTYQTPAAFTSAHQWNKKRHFPNAEMYKPGTDLADPRHYKNDSLYKGPEAFVNKRDWNNTPLSSMSKYNQGDRIFQLINEKKAFNEGKRNWEQTPPGFRTAGSDAFKANNGKMISDSTSRYGGHEREKLNELRDDSERLRKGLSGNYNTGKVTPYFEAISKPTFFTDSNGVKKERLDDQSEKDILAARNRMNSEAYKIKDAELRKGYEFAKSRRDLDSTDNNYSFDDYVRKHDPQEYARRQYDSMALYKDKKRTWYNGNASENELERRQEADRANRQNAYADFNKQQKANRAEFQTQQISRMRNAASTNTTNSMQNMYRSVASSLPKSSQQAYKAAMNSVSLGRTQAAYNSAVSRASSLFSTGSDRTRMSRATYNKSVSAVGSAAKQRVASYATKARTNAGKAFTNYMTKMAEASKTIDADLWSF